MKNSKSTTIGILTVALMASSLFISSFLTSPVSAQAGAAVVSGKATAYNVNKSGANPETWYTSSPPLIAAQRIGSGAVVAGGIASTARDTRWNNVANPSPYLNVFLDVAFQWMVSGATNVLWYEGYGVYNTAARCPQLISTLESLGYTVTSDTTEPITSSLLAPYDILVIPQLEVSNPDLFPDSDVEVIKSFVEGGKGLLIMDQSDFQGFNYYKVHNKILSGLGFDYWFQHDQAADNTNMWGGADYQLITTVDATTAIGSAYQARTGTTELGLYSMSTLMPATPLPEYQVSVSSSDGGQLGELGVTLTFHMTIKNVGLKSDTYTLTVGDNLGWSPSITVTSASLGSGASKSFNVRVTIPSGLTTKVADEIVVRAVGASGAEDSTTLVAAAHVPENLKYPTKELLPGEVYYWFSANTIRVESPAAPIMSGTETGFGTDLTAREPWPLLYGVGEYPPIGAAELIGNGRIIALGGLPILRSAPVAQFTDSRLAAEKLMPLIARWLIDWQNPSGKKFLFYFSSGAFHGPSNLSEWLKMVGNELGFDLTTMEGGRITPELLAGYDVLQTAMETALSEGDILAIADWVENGGALLLMEQADYGGFGNVPNSNTLLENIGSHIRFNDDELYDQTHWTKDGAWFPQVYLLDARSVNPKFDVWFPGTAVTSQILKATKFSTDNWQPGTLGKNNNGPVNFELVITNTGTQTTTYVIGVTEITTTPLGWPTSIDQTEVTIPAGENREVIITVTVPNVAENEFKTTRWVATAAAAGASFVKSEVEFMAVAEYKAQEAAGEISLPIIAAAIVVVMVVIAIIAYWAVKIR